MLAFLKKLLRAPEEASPRVEPPGRAVDFHEDDYCQIELLPLAARAFCAAQMGLIEEFAVEHAMDGGGYSDLYVRPDPPSRLRDLAIPLGALDAAMRTHFPPFDRVTTGYSSHTEPAPSTFAWGDEAFVLFADHDDGTVAHAWLDLRFDEAAALGRVAAALRAVPRSEELLVADWAWGAVVPLGDEAALNAYLAWRAV